MYAIVDIETTGGHASGHGITEICIILHDGLVVESQFHTLINPNQTIPHFITALTGITNQMVAAAPQFDEIAGQIYDLLHGRIFIAHNVNFDYSFVKHHLQQAGYELGGRKLCTVRYARKVKPGFPSYSLGKLCRQLDIEMEERHRANGDAEATVKLFELLIKADTGSKHLAEMLKGRNADQYLPLNVPRQQLDDLPYCAGIYYFKNRTGKVIYVGKAINLKYRVRSHFSNNATNRRKQDMMKEVCCIEYKVCATELMALVLESVEIKRLWPEFNRSQKGFEHTFALYSLEDQNGMLRLAVEKKRKHLPAIHCFHKLEEGYSLARKAAALSGVQEDYVFAFTNAPALNIVDRAHHNTKMREAIRFMQDYLPTYAILQDGKNEMGQPLQVAYLIEKGKFMGLSYIADESVLQGYTTFKAGITLYPDYDAARSMLISYAAENPDAVFRWD